MYWNRAVVKRSAKTMRNDISALKNSGQFVMQRMVAAQVKRP
jgi:hypothetical protein